MSFVFTALLAAFLYAVGILGEKYFIEHHGSVSEWTLVFLSTLVFVIVSIGLLPFAPINIRISYQMLLVFLATGGLYAGAMILWFYAINRESASKVGQLASLESVVTPLFGIIFLNESPSIFALVAISLIIVGLFVLVFDRGVARAIVTAKVAVIPIFICLLMWASQDTIIKFALTKENFWTVFFWTRIVSFGCFVGLAFKPSVSKDVRQLLYNWREDNTHILFVGKIATTFGLLTAVLAMSLGPLSLVLPVLASYPVFVFIIGTVISRITPVTLEETEAEHLIKRTVSIGLFISGIVLLYLM